VTWSPPFRSCSALSGAWCDPLASLVGATPGSTDDPSDVSHVVAAGGPDFNNKNFSPQLGFSRLTLLIIR
jgi:hypothetical protein